MISIVIPAYNEEKWLFHILDDLYQQSIPHNLFEVVVVDNGSFDLTKEVVWDFFQLHPLFPLRLVHEYKKGVSIAKNSGARNCLYEYIIFLDADNRVPVDFLSQIFDHINRTNCFASTLKTLPDGFSIRGYLFFHFLNLIKIIKFKPFGKVLIKKSIFEKIDGFNPTIFLGENVDLLVKAKKFICLNGCSFTHFNNVAILCSLRRFEKQGFIRVLIPWLIAYLGFYNLNYKTVDLLK